MQFGPFTVGQQPIITAVVTDVTGGTDVSSAVVFTIISPSGSRSEFSSPNELITNPSTNTWKLKMPVITQEGTYGIRCKSVAGLIGSKAETMYVENTQFD